MWQYNNTNELYHFGILGMKWGHHKARLAEYDKEYEKGTNKILNTSKSSKETNRRLTRLTNRLDKKYADSIKYREVRQQRVNKIKKTAGYAAGAAVVAAYVGVKLMKVIEAASKY